MAAYELRFRGDTLNSHYLHSCERPATAYEIDIAALRSEIEALKLRLEATNQRRDREMMEVQETLRQEQNREERDKGRSIDEGSERLHLALCEYEDESKRSAALRHDLLTLRARNGEDMGELQRDLRSLQLNLDFLKSHSLGRLQHEADTIRADSEREQADFQANVKSLELQFQIERKEWQNRISAKEALIKNLEYETASLQTELSGLTSTSTCEIASLTSTLQSLQKVVATQEGDFAQLSKSEKAARKSAHRLNHEVLRLDGEMRRIRSENLLLQSSRARLSRMVYEKGSKASV